jgi:hypothetical protein
MYIVPHVKELLLLSGLNEIGNLSTDFSKSTQNIKFNKICLVGGEFGKTDEQTDRQTDMMKLIFTASLNER